MALSDNSLTYIHKDGHDMLRALFLLLLLLRNPDLPQLPAHPELRTAVQVWMGLGSASRWLPLVSTDLHVLNCVLEKRLPSATWGGKKTTKRKKTTPDPWVRPRWKGLWRARGGFRPMTVLLRQPGRTVTRQSFPRSFQRTEKRWRLVDDGEVASLDCVVAKMLKASREGNRLTDCNFPVSLCRLAGTKPLVTQKKIRTGRPSGSKTVSTWILDFVSFLEANNSRMEMSVVKLRNRTEIRRRRRRREARTDSAQFTKPERIPLNWHFGEENEHLSPASVLLQANGAAVL